LKLNKTLQLKIDKMTNTLITIENKPIDIQLGSLLQLKTAKYEKGVTELAIKQDGIETIYKIGNTNSIPPIMVAVEVVKENTKTAHLFDEVTGINLKSSIKVLCQWFSQNTNQFHERWLGLDMLEIIPTKNENIDFEIGNVVSLKSVDYSEEFIKTLKEGAFPTISKKDVKDKPELAKIETIGYKITRIFKDASYSPPKMLITAINEVSEKDKKPLYDKVTGSRSRYATVTKVKCMWYDHKKGKYSEHTFTKEALVLLEDKSTNELIENKILDVFKDVNS
jgi:uncharacterized protein YodC (DUF2158 family)